MSIYSYGQWVDILSSWKEDAQNRLLEINKLEEKMHTLLSLNARLVEDAERMADWAREFYACHEMEDHNFDVEIITDISAHRALMAEINGDSEPNCTMVDA